MKLLAWTGLRIFLGLVLFFVLQVMWWKSSLPYFEWGLDTFRLTGAGLAISLGLFIFAQGMSFALTIKSNR